MSYSNHYFKKDNKDCLCYSCEVTCSNGWNSKAAHTRSQVSKQFSSRATRQEAERRKREVLGRIVYSYRALGEGRRRERHSEDYHNLIPESEIYNYGVCKLRVAYSSFSHLCASCYLRTASSSTIEETL